ncbi:MAG: SRPBCC family protein [Acidimicrobiia bacterium]
MKAMASISIQRPVDEVFDFVTDVENMPRWVSGVSGARMVSKAMEKGASYVIDYVTGWRSSEVEIEVVDFERPKVFASKASRGPIGYEGRMELTSDGKSTSITNIIEDNPDSLATTIANALLGPLLRGARRRRLQKELEQLRSAISTG